VPDSMCAESTAGFFFGAYSSATDLHLNSGTTAGEICTSVYINERGGRFLVQFLATLLRPACLRNDALLSKTSTRAVKRLLARTSTAANLQYNRFRGV